MYNDFEYLSTTEAARLLKASRDSVVRLIARGKLRGAWIARRWLVTRSQVEQLAKTYTPQVGKPRQKRKYSKRSLRWFSN